MPKRDVLLPALSGCWSGQPAHAMDHSAVITSSSGLGCNSFVAARCGKIVFWFFLLLPFSSHLRLSLRQVSPIRVNHLNNLMSLFVMPIA